MQPRTFQRWRKRPFLALLPLSLAVVCVLPITAVAGQALGAALAGRSTGDAGVAASRALRFTSADTAVVGGPDLNRANATGDTAGLLLTAAFRMRRGEDSITIVQVRNSSNATRSS